MVNNKIMIKELIQSVTDEPIEFIENLSNINKTKNKNYVN